MKLQQNKKKRAVKWRKFGATENTNGYLNRKLCGNADGILSNVSAYMCTPLTSNDVDEQCKLLFAWCVLYILGITPPPLPSPPISFKILNGGHKIYSFREKYSCHLIPRSSIFSLPPTLEIQVPIRLCGAQRILCMCFVCRNKISLSVFVYKWSVPRIKCYLVLSVYLISMLTLYMCFVYGSDCVCSISIWLFVINIKLLSWKLYALSSRMENATNHTITTN